MQAKNISEMVLSTKFVICAEFRSAQCENVKYTDKKGQARSVVRAKYSVEFDGTHVELAVRVDEGMTPERFVPPAKRGEKIALQVLEVRPSAAAAGAVYLTVICLGKVE